ncbi:MAG TPA: hypothetical protein VMS31_13370, partial [Pyrinomonadaceae bacterium]|nr:hypothetical protein [Pyrinomonadaceae bacterium]
PLTLFTAWIVRSARQSELCQFILVLTGVAVCHVVTDRAVLYAAISEQEGLALDGLSLVLLFFKAVRLLLGDDLLTLIKERVKNWLTLL